MKTLRELIKERGLTNKVVTDALGVHSTNIGRYDDLTKRSIEELKVIADSLSMDISDLLGITIHNYTDSHEISGNIGVYNMGETGNIKSDFKNNSYTQKDIDSLIERVEYLENQIEIKNKTIESQAETINILIKKNQ